MDKRNLFSTIKYAAGWPLSLAALYFIYKLIEKETSTISIVPSHIEIFPFITSIVIFLVFYALRGLVWHKILHALNVHTLSYKETAFLYSTSEIKRYIPGNIWGFLARTVAFSNKDVPKTTLLTALFVEAQIIIVSCMMVSLLAIPYFMDWVVHDWIAKGVIQILCIIGAITLSILYIFHGSIVKNILEKVSNPKARDLLSSTHYLFPGFSPYVNFYLLVIGSLTFLLYGLGTYFAIVSIFFLPPQLIFQLAGVFTLSLLLGYLSLITPMGLGVREGVITSSLTKLIPVHQAAFSSIAARILLIISEMFFIVVLLIWKSLDNKIIRKIESYILHHVHESLLVVFILLYNLYFITASMLRYENFYAGKFDLGNMDQVVWNTLHGNFFQFTDPNGTETISRLAFHSDFILMLLAPFYAIWSDPRMLLIIQTLIISLGAVFVYKLSLKILKKQDISLIFAFIYLLNPSVQHINLYDFHPVTFATTFLLAAFYYLYSKNYILFIFYAILAVLTKEQIWAIIGIAGIYIFMKGLLVRRTKEIILGFFITIICFGMFYFLVAVFIPSFRGGEHFALSYYSNFGGSPGEIIKNLLFQPHKTLQVLLQYDKLEYAYLILSPLGFISLLGLPYLLFSLPDIAINLLSNNTQLRDIHYQYTASIIPFIFISAIFGLRKFTLKFDSLSPNFFIPYLLLWIIISSYYFGPLPGAKYANIDMFIKPQQKKEIINNVIASIPQSGRIAATNNLGAHLSQRENIYTIPVGIDKADYLLFLLNDLSAQPSLTSQINMVEELKNNPKYKLVFEKEDFVVFTKQKKFR